MDYHFNRGIIIALDDISSHNTHGCLFLAVSECAKEFFECFEVLAEAALSSGPMVSAIGWHATSI